MGAIRIGTCSWTDPGLIGAGTFYPPEAKDAESRLRFYSQQFPIVEVDSSYYALPSFYNAKLWAERTPEDFTFDVKAFSLFTNHPTKLSSLPKDVAKELGPLPPNKANLYYRDVPGELRTELWNRFKSALEPLREAKKLGTVLLQFPLWFKASSENKDHILRCVEYLKPLRCSIEFRSASWLTEGQRSDTLSFLRTNDLPFVCVDEPQGFQSSVPLIAEVTSDIALVRFHGRNAENWEKKGITAAERFNWYYSEAEMLEWVPLLERMASETKEVHALINTNYQDQGVVNGRLLQRLLWDVTAD